ncbi:diguanylate cyclase [Singulisphaera sp. PoT]|uniref:diguanylate cyclase n=1 Tax=Singulisphaera sp. PoT TaxID=3411797 RepID=UPI003BF4AE86
MVSPDEELERLAALRRYGVLDTESEAAFDDIGRLAAYLCNTPIAMISLVDGDRVWFKARHGSGIEQTPRVGSFCSRAILGDGVFMVPDAGVDSRFEAHPLVAGEPGVRFYAGATLVDAGGHRLGTLCVMDLRPRELDPRQVEMLEALGRQVVALLAPRVARITEGEACASRVREAEIQSLNRELEIAYDATIEGWAKALDLRDKETEGHTRRVTEMSLRLARALGIGGQDLVHIRRGALLHDIGKLGVPDAVLLKAGELTEDEWAIMRRHPSNARDWLESIPVLRRALEIPYSHHEKWDGTGYPEGLAGEAIPLAARLFAAVDIWDALRSDRPYRAAWTDERVRSHLRSLAGSHLDPAVVAVFLRVLEDGSARIETPATSARPETAEVIAKVPARSPEVRPRVMPQAEGPPRARKRGLAGQLELWRRNSRLAELVNTDSLTGLRNRRYFHQVLQSSFNDCVREGRPLTLILFDLDGFKAYNDRHGHSAGDEVLRELANLLRHQIGPDDVVARYGGEEFAALLHWGDARDGLGWVETLRARMLEHRWPRTPVTASFGLSTLTPDTHTSTMLIEQADHAMFAAKRLGRDRVVRHEDFSISRIESFW